MVTHIYGAQVQRKNCDQKVYCLYLLILARWVCVQSYRDGEGGRQISEQAAKVKVMCEIVIGLFLMKVQCAELCSNTLIEHTLPTMYPNRAVMSVIQLIKYTMCFHAFINGSTALLR